MGYFENEKRRSSILREGFPREFIYMNLFTYIMDIVSPLCKRLASPIPSGMGEISFP